MYSYYIIKNMYYIIMHICMYNIYCLGPPIMSRGRRLSVTDDGETCKITKLNRTKYI